MSDQPAIERMAARRQKAQEFEALLTDAGFAGPYRFGSSFDALSTIAGGGLRERYAICLTCGSVVVIDDPMPSTKPGSEDAQVERGIYLHTEWHRTLESR